MDKSSILAFLKKNKHLLSEKYQVEHIGLFGSYAAETHTPHSDIDILVEMPSSFDLYYDLKEFLEKSLGKTVDLGLKKSLRGLIGEKIDKEIIYV